LSIAKNAKIKTFKNRYICIFYWKRRCNETARLQEKPVRKTKNFNELEEILMIGYTTVGTNDFDKAVAFYDALLTEMGAGRFMENDRFVAWAVAPDKPAFSICKPYDGNAATVGNGTMIALSVASIDLVDRIHARALELGGSDEGAPGLRFDNFYAGYFRDLEGKKLNVCCFQPAAG
jgi:catechol 2,3-dioxygenase-like lactoylglutathione lyase family enzyme